MADLSGIFGGRLLRRPLRFASIMRILQPASWRRPIPYFRNTASWKQKEKWFVSVLVCTPPPFLHRLLTALAPAMKKHLVHEEGSGFLEKGQNLILEPHLQPEASQFFNYYNVRFQRIYDIELSTRKAMHDWIMESPLYMLVCGAPDIEAWWNDFFVFDEDGGYVVDEDAPKDGKYNSYG
jgi:hypothetical protein